MARRIGVMLAGSGYLDGSEIHEATLTLYFLDKAGARIVCMAPNKPQAHVVDHLTGQPVPGERNVLVESARIARGKVRDVAQVSAEELDALVIPGGFGAAKNLCTFAMDGADCEVDDGVATLIRAMHAARKPIGALCIAPAVLAKVLGHHHVTLTIGDDAGTAAALESMGARHVDRVVDGIAIDEAHRIVSTPCYMLAKGPAAVGAGVEKLVAHVLAWLDA